MSLQLSRTIAYVLTCEKKTNAKKMPFILDLSDSWYALDKIHVYVRKYIAVKLRLHLKAQSNIHFPWIRMPDFIMMWYVDTCATGNKAEKGHVTPFILDLSDYFNVLGKYIFDDRLNCNASSLRH